MPTLGGWELVILLGVLVLVFGAKRLPDMARSVGQSARVFKGEMKGLKKDTDQAPDDAPAPPAPTVPGRELPADTGTPTGTTAAAPVPPPAAVRPK
jgi:sec-independent protein translocase protein TatA